MVRDYPLTGVGPNMVPQALRAVPDPDYAVQAIEPAPAQRPAADRGRARPAGAGHLDRVRRGRSRMACSACSGRERETRRCAAAGLRRHRAACSPPASSIQLRRLRVPDALPRARHAAVRRSPPRRCCCRRSRLTARARSSRAPGGVARPRRRRRHARQVHRRPRDAHLAGSAGPGRHVRPRHVPDRRRRQRRAQRRRRSAGRPRSSPSPAATRRPRRCAQACREAGIAPSFVGDAGRPTTTKVRIVTERNQQVARIDYESDAEIAGEIEERIIADDPASTRRAAPRSSCPTT